MKIYDLQIALFLACIVSLALSIVSCNSPTNPNQQSNVKFDQYFVKGEVLYGQHCSNCHQKGGTGLGRVYPPVHKSDLIDSQKNKVLCILKNGIAGELIVNGVMYNQTMKSPGLTDLEIAEIATFVYNSWGRKAGIIEVSEVTRVVMKCDSSAIR